MKFSKQQRTWPLALIFIFSTGCASNAGVQNLFGSSGNSHVLDSAANIDGQNAVEQDHARQLSASVAATAEDQSAANPDAAVPQGTANDQDLFPPGAKPGHCYARVLKPAEFKTSEEQVLKSEASYRIEVVAPTYEWVEEEVVTQEATTKLEVVPAKYKTVTEQILVKPEGRKLVEIPAEYRTEEERVLDRPAHTIWKRSNGPVDAAIQTRQDQSTGEIVCLVEVPASYKIVKQTVLASPARTEEIIIPAEYESVTKVVEIESAGTREIHIPATTKIVKTRRLVEPAQEHKVELPASYETVVKRTKVSEEELIWQEVLCQINMTDTVVADIQQKLNDEGYDSGAVDGKLGAKTLHAVNSYAEDNSLPAGKNYIAVETVESLGINY